MAFHPQDEGLLAFGTSDGRIGIFNLTKKRNNMSLLKTVLAHSIYRLCWAPPPTGLTTNETEYSLYAVGNGQILIYSEMNLWKGKINLLMKTKFLTLIFRRVEQCLKLCKLLI